MLRFDCSANCRISLYDQHWREVIDACPRFGKGRHKARLNFGDCLSFAVARLADEPLPFTGDDFPQTDLALAWRPRARARPIHRHRGEFVSKPLITGR
jgi:uncharacterized protein with PIN domain